MEIVTDLKVIKKLAKKREDENWDFRSFLKGYHMDMEELDEIVHDFYEQVVKEIDCRDCGNCCRVMSPALEECDIERMAEGLGICISDFKNRYLKKNEKNFSGELIFNNRPCPFQKNNLCSCYEHRPEDCRSFPHLHKDEFVFRLVGVVQNYKICPIVFNVYEMLKRRFSWPRKRRRGRYGR